MLQVVCFNAGNYCGIGKKYTEILYDQVRRNLSDKTPGKFVCFTDDPEPYAEGIEKRDLYPGLRGWWNVPYVYKDGLFPDGDTIMLLGLDTCIVSGIDKIAQYDGEFGLLRDVYVPGRLQNSVTIFKAGTAGHIWNLFEKMGFPENLERGEQEIIELAFKKKGTKPDILSDIFRYQIVSYKVRAQFQIPRDAKIVYFHGHPRPHEVKGNWVEHVWKIGGGSVLELENVCNVSEQDIERNVRHACSLPVEHLANQYMKPSEHHVAIVGGGPSLADEIEGIRFRQKEGQVIWALNNAYKYLADHGIYSDAHIMLDARPENAKFVPTRNVTKIYSSQCHPDVFKKALEGEGKVIIWHPYFPDILGLLDELALKVAFIGCGNSVGLKAMGLANLFGFKYVHLYGYDSSYRDDKNHAYDQPLNAQERTMEVILEDRKFKCAPWMASQTIEFRESVMDFIKKGMIFTVHGDGLLPFAASLLNK